MIEIYTPTNEYRILDCKAGQKLNVRGFNIHTCNYIDSVSIEVWRSSIFWKKQEYSNRYKEMYRNQYGIFPREPYRTVSKDRTRIYRKVTLSSLKRVMNTLVSCMEARQ